MTLCCVLGLGYIGLPTSIIIAKAGYKVVGVDVDENVVSSINNGIVHIKEPFLQEALTSVLGKGTLSASLIPVKAEVYIIAVPTPFYSNKKSIPEPNITYVKDAIKSILPYLKKGSLVILESTSPIGTTKIIADIIFENKEFSKKDIFIAYCPERVLPGNILYELVHNDRVIGGINEESSNKAVSYYKEFSKGKLIKTSSETAELVKLSENAYRDVNIAFANELSMISEKFEIDVNELISIANHHPRVNILNPGCGVGGHCIAVDPWFIASSSPDDTPLIQTARFVNNKKVKWVINKIKALLIKSQLPKEDKIIGIFGIAYKSDIDDLRESPALKIALELQSEGYTILVSEPNITSHDELKIREMHEVLDQSFLSVFLVSHNEFQDLDLQDKNFLDLCGVSK